MCAQQTYSLEPTIGTKMKCGTNNQALANLKLGRLVKMYDKIHAYGITDKRKRVWLPIVPNVKNPFHEFHLEKYNGMDLILEYGNKPQKKNPDMETAYVIKRTKCKGGYEFEYIGKYKQVLFDKKLGFTVHRKDPSTIMCDSKNELLWDDTVASSEAEIRKLIDELYKKHAKEDK